MQKLKAKKSLGQNFLKSTLALNTIIKTGEIKKDDVILEIGPGKGALTRFLLEKSNYVIAIEKDKRMVKFLEEKFQKEIRNKNLILLEDDILETEVEKLLKKNNIQKLNYKIIANIPYNITGAILKKFLSSEKQPEKMVLLVQKEVADRIAKLDNKKIKENLLSVSVKAYGLPKIIMKVSKRYFSPIPKVDSSVLEISNISKNIFLINKIEEKFFWEVVRTGFAHKRKTLIKNLNTFNKKIDWQNLFERLQIEKTARAEELSIEKWILLIKMLKTLHNK